jgi:hypothetical protein
MKNTNYVVTTSNAIFGYIDESTPCGRAKAKQVKADLEQLAIMQNDSNLTASTKQAIIVDYAKAIREYVEREEDCSDCTNDCECYEEEEEEEEITINDIERYSIYFGKNKEIDCYDYAETIEKVELLLQLNPELKVYGYDGQGGMYRLKIIRLGKEIFLEMPE